MKQQQIEKRTEISCPECASQDVTLYIEEEEHGFCCMECRHKWGRIKNIYKNKIIFNNKPNAKNYP